MTERLTREHEYTSTACHHEQHDHCRRVCKFCEALCACACHPAEDAAVVRRQARADANREQILRGRP